MDHSRVLAFNKRKLNELLQSLEKIGKLSSKTMKDFEIIERVSQTPERKKSEIFKVIEKSTSACLDISNSSGCEFKTLKKMEIDLTKKQNFFQEMQALSGLSHKNIKKLESVFIEPLKDCKLVFYCVFPHCQHNLKTWVLQAANAVQLQNKKQTTTKKEEKDGRRTIQQFVKILNGLLDGLNYLHSQKIVHLNLDIENVMINENEECVISWFNQNFDETSIVELQKKKNREVAPEILSYKTRRAILASVEDENIASLEKTDFFTTATDIFSIGKILFELCVADFTISFINSDEQPRELCHKIPIISIPKEKITLPNIENRLDSFFRFADMTTQQPAVCSEQLLQFFERTIKAVLMEDPNQRPSAQTIIEHLQSIQTKICESPEVAFRRALRYSEDDGIHRDYQKALNLFEKLSRAPINYPPAAYHAGFFHLHGVGGYLNKKEGAKECKKAGSQSINYFQDCARMFNDPHAHYTLSTMYYFGFGTPSNPPMAFYHTRAAALLGHTAAVCNMAMILEDRGAGGPPPGAIGPPPATGAQQRPMGPPPGAMGPPQGAMGPPPATGAQQRPMGPPPGVMGPPPGVMGPPPGIAGKRPMGPPPGAMGPPPGIGNEMQLGPPGGIPVDMTFANYGYAAERGECLGQFFTGFMAEELNGDLEKAFHYYKLAADNHFVRAYGKLAAMYENGDGVDQDEEKMVYYLKLGAEAGDTEAQLKLASFYETGITINETVVLERDLQMAIDLYKRAVDAGEFAGLFCLVKLYTDGSEEPDSKDFTVKKDAKKVLHFARLAANCSGGDESSRAKIARIIENEKKFFKSEEKRKYFLRAEHYYKLSSTNGNFSATNKLNNMRIDGKVEEGMKLFEEF